MILYATTGLFYYPKYKKQGTEATISWDVAGYYLYLPAVFIQKDLKKLSKESKVRSKYYYAPNSDSYYDVDNGNKVLKYSIGMSILYTPAFIVGHIIALLSDYDADGYSLPYQFSLMVFGFVIVFIGLFYLRKILLIYYDDWVVTWTILIIGLCTNLLEYGAITNAMSHNYLFAGYAILLWNTKSILISNQRKYYYGAAVIIGLMALARPTEAISVLLPILYLWYSKKGKTYDFIKVNIAPIIFSMLIIVAIGSIQIVYWYYVSGNVIQYSYQDQGFSWLHPHVIDGMFSFRAGWLVYTPVMILSLLGFYLLKSRVREWFYPSLIYTMVFIYIAFAWDIWWYGGSLGQRTMVQLYPILALPLGALISSVTNKYIKLILFTFIGVCGYLNMWMTHQAHNGGLIKVGEMTKPYYLAIIGKSEVDKEVNKLLDARYIHTDPISEEVLLYGSADTICLTKENQSTQPIYQPISSDMKYVRMYVNYDVTDPESVMWRWTQMVVKFNNAEGNIVTNMLRMQRLDNGIGSKKVYLDSKVPKGAEQIEVYLWHAESHKKLCISNIKLVNLR